MQTITLDHAHAVITGKIRGHSRSALDALFRARGGRTGKKMMHYDMPDLLLVGNNPNAHMIEEARALGVHVIEGEALQNLLQHGQITIEEELGTRTFDELIGPLRALLAEALTPESWLELCRLVELCQPEEMERLLAYLSPQLKERRAIYEAHQVPFEYDHAELQIFPVSWLAQVLRGVSHPKFSLCKSLNFEGFPVYDLKLAEVFEQDALSHVTRIDTGDPALDRERGSNYRKGEWFFRKLSRSTCLPHLHTLVVGWEEDGYNVQELMISPSHLSGVRELYLRRQDDSLTGPYLKGADLIAYGPWSPTLEMLGLQGVYLLDELARYMPRVPELKHLALQFDRVMTQDELESCAEHLPVILPQLDRLSLSIAARSEQALDFMLGAWLDMLEGHELEVLDLRGCFTSSEARERGTRYLSTRPEHPHIREIWIER